MNLKRISQNKKGEKEKNDAEEVEEAGKDHAE